MRRVALCLLFASLAGCAGSGEYPDSFLLQPNQAPDGYDLLTPDHPMWNESADELGLDKNPGPIHPMMVHDLLSTGRVEEPHAALYANVDGGVILSLAFQFEDLDQRASWMASDAANLCLDGTPVFSKGYFGAAIYHFGAEPDAIQHAAGSIARSSGADNFCKGIDAPPGAVQLVEGENGPFSITPRDETDWYVLEVGQERTVTIGIDSGDDPEMWVYTDEMELVGYDDDTNGADPEIRTLMSGTVWVRVQSYAQSEEIPAYTMYIA